MPTFDRDTGEVFEFVPRSYGRHKQVTNSSFDFENQNLRSYSQLDYWGEKKRNQEEKRRFAQQKKEALKSLELMRPKYSNSFKPKKTKAKKAPYKKSFYKKAKPIIKYTYYKTKRFLNWIDNF